MICNQTRLLRNVAGFFFVVSIVLSASAIPASAHGIGGIGPTDSETVITSIKPPTNAFAINPIENGQKMQLTRTGNKDIVVLGVDSEPYILINSKGTFLNEKSATRIINRSTNSTVPVSESNEEFSKTSGDPRTTPKWIKQSSKQTYKWHDHRAHYMGTVPNGVTELGTSSFPILSGDSVHTINVKFVTTKKVNTTPYIGVGITLTLIIVSSLKIKKIANVLWSRIFLLSSSIVLCIFEVIHIFGYARFSDASVVQSLISSLYGTIFLMTCLLLVIKLARIKEVNNSHSFLNRHAPLLSVAGFMGLSAGSLVEYEIFTRRYLSTTLDPTLSRWLVLLVGVMSLNLLICGIKNIKHT